MPIRSIDMQSQDARSAPRTLYRYLTLAKFLDLLETKTLFFSPANLLPDKSEGVTLTQKALIAHEMLLRFSKQDVARQSEQLKLIKEKAELQEAIAEFVFLNCWHASNYESYTMWKTYVPQGDGVCIITDEQRLLDSMRPIDDLEILIGSVQYPDMVIEDEGGYIERFFKKNKPYLSESEVRLAIDFMAIEREKRACIEEVKEMVFKEGGIRVPVDLNILVRQMRFCPGMSPWVKKLITKSLVRENIPYRMVLRDSGIELRSY